MRRLVMGEVYFAFEDDVWFLVNEDGERISAKCVGFETLLRLWHGRQSR
jgi:hypothetical protein